MIDASFIPKPSFPNIFRTNLKVSHGRHLPQWTANGAVYHITAHLQDSVPAEQLQIWRAKRDELSAAIRVQTGFAREALIREMKEVYNQHIERYLTAGSGECLLRDSSVAECVEKTLLYGNGSNYELHAYTIMPNHIHVIVGGFTGSDGISEVTGKWKRISAHRINGALGRKGSLWHRDTYSHIIRTPEEYRNQLLYVWHNPEAAGLVTGFLRKAFVNF